MSYAANPRADQVDPSNAPQEGTGAIASDSLAAESLKAGGGFAENKNAHALGVRGDQSTLNTTDTSGATVLHASTDGATRESEDAQGAGTDERGASGLKYPDAAGTPDFSGTHTTTGYSGGPSSAQAAQTSSSNQPAGDSDFGATTLSSNSNDDVLENVTSSSAPAQDEPNTDETTTTSSTTDAPSSTSTSTSTPPTDIAPTTTSRPAGILQTENEQKVPGSNLTEGDIPATKTFTGNVGGSHDPGRLAEAGFEKINAAVAGAGAGGGAAYEEPAQSGGRFEGLESERL